MVYSDYDLNNNSLMEMHEGMFVYDKIVKGFCVKNLNTQVVQFVTLKGIQDKYYSKLEVEKKPYIVQKITPKNVYIVTSINLRLPYKYKSTDGCAYNGRFKGLFVYSIPKHYCWHINCIDVFY